MAAQEGRVRTRARVRRYHCFLVRCHLEENAGPTGQPAWRFSVHEAGAGGARRCFTCFDDLAAHMQAELASREASVHAENSTSAHSEVEP